MLPIMCRLIGLPRDLRVYRGHSGQILIIELPGSSVPLFCPIKLMTKKFILYSRALGCWESVNHSSNWC